MLCPTDLAHPTADMTISSFDIFFIFVYIPQVFYVEEGETLFFLSLSPKEDVVVNTYTSHTWFVKDLDTNKILHVNGHKKYIPVKTDPENPIRVFITVPSW